MNIVDIIIKKRDGKLLTAEELAYFVKGTTDGSIPDYQISAFLMAIYFSGLDAIETACLTTEMAASGHTLDLSSIPGCKVDKHSTGGVSDTTTLIVAPLVASLGVPVVKMSGRGLGFSGGTLDKLEAIPGFQVEVPENSALAFAKQSNIVLMSQAENLTPADKKLYSIRDVTGTVESMPLIAASIMSKKIAAGADAIVLDVKCGSGAFMKDYPTAKALAEEMVSIGKQVNKKVTALISSMEQPLGNNIGNSLEVIEAIEVLKGRKKGDLLEVSLQLGAIMLLHARLITSISEGTYLLENNIKNGKGLKKLKELIVQQKGNPKVLEDYSLFPQATATHTLYAARDGYITKMNTAQIGRASLETGAGRKKKDDTVDLSAGIVLLVRLGDAVKKGNPLAILYSSTKEQCMTAAAILSDSIYIQDEKEIIPKLILDMIE